MNSPIRNIAPQAMPSTAPAPTSHAKVLRLHAIDADDFRRWFAPVWAKWLTDHFRRPEIVAATFGVSNNTAVNWMQGSNRATGDMVMRAFLTFPDALTWFLAQWEAEQ